MKVMKAASPRRARGIDNIIWNTRYTKRPINNCLPALLWRR
jgi:hypothetical protein